MRSYFSTDSFRVSFLCWKLQGWPQGIGVKAARVLAPTRICYGLGSLHVHLQRCKLDHHNVRATGYGCTVAEVPRYNGREHGHVHNKGAPKCSSEKKLRHDFPIVCFP